MRKRLSALWLVLVAIRSGVLVTQMRHGLILAVALALAGCGLVLSPEAPANPSATLVSEVLPSPGAPANPSSTSVSEVLLMGLASRSGSS